MPSCHRSEALLPPQLQSQLLRDLQHWPPQSVSLKLLDEAHGIESGIRAAVAVVNNTVYWLRPLHGRSSLLTAMVDDLVELTTYFSLPDVELSLNVGDEPIVPLQHAAVPPPVFSFFGTAAAADILAPSAYFRTLHFDRALQLGPQHYRDQYPWRGKRPAATWRGSLFCGPNRFMKCSRALLAHLSAQNASSLLDVRFVTYQAAHDPYLMSPANPNLLSDLAHPPAPLATAPHLAIAAHSASRFLIHLDGYSASTRLQSLLLSNSALLKQDSYFWEYYHSSLQPHQNYIPFWERSPRDIITVLANASRPSQSARMQRMGERTSALAHRILSPRARRLYWLALLGLYARRLKQSPNLARWPRAKPAPSMSRSHRMSAATSRDRGKGGASSTASPDLDSHSSSSRCEHDEGTRSADEAHVAWLISALESRLADARRHEREPRQREQPQGPADRAAPPPQRHRSSVVSAMPAGGDSSVPLAFESDVERRALGPELDHAAAAQRMQRYVSHGG